MEDLMESEPSAAMEKSFPLHMNIPLPENNFQENHSVQPTVPAKETAPIEKHVPAEKANKEKAFETFKKEYRALHIEPSPGTLRALSSRSIKKPSLLTNAEVTASYERQKPYLNQPPSVLRSVPDIFSHFVDSSGAHPVSTSVFGIATPSDSHIVPHSAASSVSPSVPCPIPGLVSNVGDSGK